jgi:hypothetical protein
MHRGVEKTIKKIFKIFSSPQESQIIPNYVPKVTEESENSYWPNLEAPRQQRLRANDQT